MSFKNIFVGGDLTDMGEEKSAQTAEYHGIIIAGNILNTIEGRQLQSYKPQPRITVISLGDNYGIVSYKSFSTAGILEALLKKTLETKTIFRYRHL